MAATLKFCLGQVVRHSESEFRGVIYEVDDRFRGSDEMLSDLRGQRGSKDRPWYHVLVDGTDKTLYVPEGFLSLDPTGLPVHHPLLDELFIGFEQGRYLKSTH